LSSSRLRPYPTNHAKLDGELSCTHADAKTEGSGGRPIIPTPTLNQHDLRRRYIFDGAGENGRNQPARKHATAPIVPRAPDTTVLATAVDVNVQDGNTTIANTLVLQASDATVVSFTSLGVLTVPAPPTTASDSTTTTYDSSQSVASSLSLPDTSLPTDSLNSSTLPTSSLPPGYNSSATSTSDITTTITLTSTLNVSFFNGTVVTLPNPSDTTAPTNLTSSTSNTDSRTDRNGHSTVTSAMPASSTSIPASATGSMDNSPGAAASSGGTGAAGYGSPTTAVSSATSSSSSSNTGSGPGPTTPTVVGGVVGGVAGLAFLLLILLTLLRCYRKRLQARGQLPEQIAARSATGDGPGATNQMSSRSSHTPFAAAILSSTRRWRPQSSATTATAVTDYSTVPDSERGFQRIAGRKIGPVIGTSSDQYGGNYGAFEKDFAEGRLTRAGPASSQTRTANNEERGLAESSFYRDSQGFYGGKGEPLPASPTLVSSSLGHRRSSTRDLATTDSIGESSREGAPDGHAVMRPSPARTPMTSSPSNSSLRLPIQQGTLMEPGAPPTPALPSHLTGRRPDGVGRSLGSQDGSRGSRFTESV
jgi:hypothetical protein